ncbi:MAG: outer membrane protein [Verrucomicrobiales bacterium]
MNAHSFKLKITLITGITVLFLGYSQVNSVLAGPYYYSDSPQSGYDGGSANGHPYLGGMVALTNSQRGSFLFDNAGDESINIDFDTDTGWMTGIKFGYQFPESGLVKYMLETELLYGKTDFNGLGESNDLAAKVGGSINTLALMLNGLVKLDLGMFEPYGGLGIGFANANTSSLTTTVGGKEVAVDDVEGWGWAWQIIVGGEIMLFSDRIGLFGEYKYLGLQSIESIERYRTHVFGTGIRVHF